MSQGKEWNKDEVFKVLEPYFKLGCNITKACSYAGIPRTTIQTWVENDEELRLKVTGWQNELNEKARRVWALEMDKGNVDAAIKWLTKKEKDEFSDRTELVGADGKDLIPSKEDRELAEKALENI